MGEAEGGAEKQIRLSRDVVTMVTCSEMTCEKSAFAKGLCKRHYERRRCGVSPEPRSLVERFQGKVDKENGPIHLVYGQCWVWKASLTKWGYGQFKYGDTMELAHRVAWFILHGAWPTLCVLRHCDNPPCVNPTHLFLGTDADNAADRAAKGRGNSPRGERNHNVKLTENDVLDIRSLSAMGATRRTLAEEYGIGLANVSSVITRRAWRHVP